MNACDVFQPLLEARYDARLCNTHPLVPDVHDGVPSYIHLQPARILHHIFHSLSHSDEGVGMEGCPPDLLPNPKKGPSMPWWALPQQRFHTGALCSRHLDNTSFDGDDRTDYQIGHHNSCDA